jgi:xanthine dehydrogenase YagT iron-sulfur-binding subunit
MTISDPSSALRPVRAEADEAVEVRFTVNGTAVALHLPARVTLADALRDHLGLTGTHLGCEHGVCGMCTVLVDGQATRSCLVFACQLDGSEVVTVEGLGRPSDLHPLQAAFGRHHALQCGFCTPGFLLSAFDLLTTKPDVTEDELPQALSGVLCRCTGYRNIRAAVAETQRTYPQGIPGPGNCVPRAFAGRSGSVTVPQRATATPDVSDDSMQTAVSDHPLQTERTVVRQILTVVAEAVQTVLRLVREHRAR